MHYGPVHSYLLNLKLLKDPLYFTCMISSQSFSYITSCSEVPYARYTLIWVFIYNTYVKSASARKIRVRLQCKFKDVTIPNRESIQWAVNKLRQCYWTKNCIEISSAHWRETGQNWCKAWTFSSEIPHTPWTGKRGFKIISTKVSGNRNISSSLWPAQTPDLNLCDFHLQGTIIHKL